MKKSLAQLKRDAKAGGLVMELVEHFGRTGDQIPPRLRGPRPLVDANSVSVFFLNADGKKSACDIARASLVDYDDEGLTVYRFGHRPLTGAEAAALAEWEEIRQSKQYQDQSYADAMTDGSSTYWWWKSFWSKKDMEYMSCFDTTAGHGRYYDAAINEVWDLNVRGEAILRYRIVREEENGCRVSA